MATYYDILGIDPSATQEELRLAYHRRAQLLHPDHHAGASPDVIAEAERSLRELNDAWSVLSDPQRRRQYDASLGFTSGGSPRGRQHAADDRPPTQAADGPGTRLLWMGLAVIGLLLLVDSLGRGLDVAVLGLVFLVVGIVRARKTWTR